ncbi:procathepsin L isoform X2 [Ixodes scapularis]|uniref:procathepsin L isoform X2 n=1 Tax=Ixodes scapularis TaxID=6945 RepID=UPI0011616D70|nr:procathepsin L isoform X2 [Ixodes scapularis]
MTGLFILISLCLGAWAQVPQNAQDEIDLYGNFGKAWDLFRKIYSKTYKSSEETVRREGIFRKSFNYCKSVDMQFKNGTLPYSVEINYFADMTSREVVQKYTGYNKSDSLLLGSTPLHAPLLGDFPDSLDWRKRGLVTPVKNQGQCGGCWAFSATGSLEGQVFKKTGRLVSMSEQNLLDCAGRRYGNNGCNGGQMSGAFQYVRDAGGMDTDQQYPYRAQTDFQCKFSRSTEARRYGVRGYVRVPANNERALMDACSRVGPISIAINASPQSFIFYKGGVYNDGGCDPRGLNHAVLVVGFDKDSRGTPYWIVKNSWGTGWGEAGYIKIMRNKNICGMAADPVYPTM